jgi:hypothetical protein
MSEKKGKSEKIKLVERTDNLKRFYATGVFGGAYPNECNMLFYVDTPIPTTNEKGETRTKHIERDYVVEIKMSLATFAGIAEWMNRHVDRLKQKGVLKETKKGFEIPISGE